MKNILSLFIFCILANLSFAQSATLVLDESQLILIENVDAVTTFDTNNDDPFGEGWETGHCEGWKDIKGQNVWCPTAPWAPTPDWDCGDSYRCGYNRGFKFARCKAQGYSNCKK